MKLQLGGYAKVVSEGCTTSKGQPLTGRIGKITKINDVSDPRTGATRENYVLNFGGNIGRIGWFETQHAPMIEAVANPKEVSR